LLTAGPSDSPKAISQLAVVDGMKGLPGENRQFGRAILSTHEVHSRAYVDDSHRLCEIAADIPLRSRYHEPVQRRSG
jgi:hypothetical protein